MKNMVQQQAFPPTTLAIDYGEKRLGLALSYASLAEPLTILYQDETVLGEIKQLIKDKEIKQILIGVSEGKSATAAKKFGRWLSRFISLPIFYTDETLSTKIATMKLAQAGKKIDQKALDHFAAAEFLQQWLDGGKD